MRQTVDLSLTNYRPSAVVDGAARKHCRTTGGQACAQVHSALHNVQCPCAVDRAEVERHLARVSSRVVADKRHISGETNDAFKVRQKPPESCTRQRYMCVVPTTSWSRRDSCDDVSQLYDLMMYETHHRDTPGAADSGAPSRSTTVVYGPSHLAHIAALAVLELVP